MTDRIRKIDGAFAETLAGAVGVPSPPVPYANHDEAHHSPHENLVLERFHAGIRTAAALMECDGPTPFAERANSPGWPGSGPYVRRRNLLQPDSV